MKLFQQNDPVFFQLSSLAYVWVTIHMSHVDKHVWQRTVRIPLRTLNTVNVSLSQLLLMYPSKNQEKVKFVTDFIFLCINLLLVTPNS